MATEETPRVKGFKDFMRRSGWAILALLFVVTGLGVGIVSFLQNKDSSNPNTNQTQQQLQGTPLSNFQAGTKIDKLSYSELKTGKGKVAKSGDTIVVNYTGALAATGTIFESSFDSGQTATFPLKTGPNGVIAGFAKGIEGMKEGGVRRILIPSALAYGKQGNQVIPANSDLVFDVYLISIK